MKFDLSALDNDESLQSRLGNGYPVDLKLKDHKKFSDFSTIYPFSTENLSGYMPQIDFHEKRVLTVACSGDQIINSYLLGATEVTSFDINVLSSLFCELKTAAIEELDFEDFKRFFFRGSESMNHETYEKIRKRISRSSQSFFDNCFRIYESQGNKFRSSAIFEPEWGENERVIAKNPYLQSSTNYERTQEALKDKKSLWHHFDIANLDSMIEGEFDIFLLSNIADYAHLMFSDDEQYLSRFVQETIIPLSSHLAREGVICAAYIYDVDTTGKRPDYRSQIDNLNIRSSVFGASGLSYKEQHFESVIPGKQDAVILLQKP